MFERLTPCVNSRHVAVSLVILLTFAALPAWAAGSLIISEFRLQGPNGAADEFIEIYNDSGADHTVAAISGTGYAIAASDGIVRCTIPNGTVIPARGHWLCANSGGYSLASYATADGTYTTEITNAEDPDGAGGNPPLARQGIALFNNNTGGGSFILANRFDAVGPVAEANVLYKEGAGLPNLTFFSIDHAFVRDECGKGGSIPTPGPCTISTPKDTDNNAADFYFVDTNGTSAGAGQRLGAPGPQNLSSPITPGSFASNRLDATVGNFNPPNVVRDFTSDPPNNSTFGTIAIRRRFVNNTGASVTRLRFRITDQTTFPAPSGIADLRSRTSGAVVVAGINDAVTCAATGAPATPPCTVTVQGTTLEQPPSQPNGSAFNCSMSAGTVTLGTPLASGASINLQFLFGIQQTGDYHVNLDLEGLPQGGGPGGSTFLQCGTDAGCAPTVTSIVRASPSPTGAASVDFTVTFSEAVTGVDASDFVLTTTGAIAGATITGVTGAGTTRTVTVSTGTGDGTIRLDVVDDDTIINGGAVPLGDVGAGNGDFNTGEVYILIHPPAVVSITRIGVDPTFAASIQFTVTFDESVTGVDATDFTFTTTGTVAPTVTSVTGTGATRIVTVATGGGTGTIRLDLTDDDSIIDVDTNPLGGVGAGNGSFSAGEIFTIIAVPLTIPVLDPRSLALLVLVLAGVGALVLRRL